MKYFNWDCYHWKSIDSLRNKTNIFSRPVLRKKGEIVSLLVFFLFFFFFLFSFSSILLSINRSSWRRKRRCWWDFRFSGIIILSDAFRSDHGISSSSSSHASMSNLLLLCQKNQSVSFIRLVFHRWTSCLFSIESSILSNVYPLRFIHSFSFFLIDDNWRRDLTRTAKEKSSSMWVCFLAWSPIVLVTDFIFFHSTNARSTHFETLV